MKRHPSRLVPFGLAAVLVLAACGSDEPTAEQSSGDGSVPAADSSSTDEGLMAPRPIEVSGAGAGSGAPSAAPEAASADRQMSTDMMIAPYRVVTFVPGEGLPALPTNDVGYVFQGGASVTAEQVAALAAQLGVPGEPERHEDGAWVWWQVGPNDGTAPSLTVNQDAQLSWNYSSAWADQAVTGAGCAVAGSAGAPDSDPASDANATVPSVAPEAPVCETPPPPQGVPTAEEAEARTRELMAAAGLDPDGWKFETYADEWYASVSATEQLDGAFAGRSFGAGFGAEGVMQYASGQLAEPVRVGPYPLIDLETAIERLNDPSGFYSGGGLMAVDTAMAREVYPETGAAVDVPEADVAEAAPPPATEPAPLPPATDVAEPPVTPVPVEVPAPEEVTVTLVDVQADVWWALDVDGSVWLLPAYRFIGDDGGWYTVPAVTDEFLIQVPVDTVPPASVEPAPETVPPVDTVADVTPLESSVGKTLGEFRADAEALGLTVRVVEQDGVPLAVTMDYNPTRVNVAVEGEGDAGTVIRIDSVG